MSKQTNRVDAHQIITDKIIEGLERVGANDWQCPWHRSAGTGAPVNGVTHHAYKGINWLLLGMVTEGTGCNRFASYKQWQSKGRQVRKGEHGFPVTFYKQIQVTDKAGQEGEKVTQVKNIPMLRISTVFCESQLNDYEPDTSTPARPNLVDVCQRVDDLVQVLGVDLRCTYPDRAFYRSHDDFINMPARSAFKGTKTSSPTESYYSTLLHELTHWTGHGSRCDRKLRSAFGSKDYAKEELIAELGSAYLAQEYGVSLELREDHTQYIKNWLQCLKDDKRFIFNAAALAQKACDFIHQQSTAQAVAA